MFDVTASRDSFLSLFPSIILPMFLAVLDQTIIAAALPEIAASLGHVQYISWVVVAYLVANTVAAPVYARLGDLFGRRKLMLEPWSCFRWRRCSAPWRPEWNCWSWRGCFRELAEAGSWR